VRFLLDANMPRSALQSLRAHGHDAVHVRDVGLGDAADALIAERARADNRALISRDLDFADVRRYPPGRATGIVVLRLPENWTAAQINRLLERFLSMRQLVECIPGRLVMLDPRQVRFRPALDQQ
jgi:predicted nuclease of predicted toxin-antitoxin system